MVQLLVGGYDKAPHLFSVDAAGGGAVEDVYVSTGSGSPFVYGVLERDFRKDMPVDDAIEMVVRGGITAAKQRDSASGGA